jgi:hypothetical protein
MAHAVAAQRSRGTLSVLPADHTSKNLISKSKNITDVDANGANHSLILQKLGRRARFGAIDLNP